jgi:hypothetical protein
MYKQQAFELSVGLDPSNYLSDNTIMYFCPEVI